MNFLLGSARSLVFFGLFAVLVFSGCEESQDVSIEVSIPEQEVRSEEVVGESAVAEPSDFTFSRETTVAEASSELVDDTGYGFAYHPANVLDMDFSTAWCADAQEAMPILALNFSAPVAFTAENNWLGVVPGFARDESIFFQNNRIKTMLVWVDDLPEPLDTFSFEDRYAMQFVDLPIGEFQTIRLEVTEVYPGSKYDDTCVAEVDFWSDWVTIRDADAAYAYYLENKADQALRPVSIDHVFLSYTDSTTTSTCKDYMMTTFDTTEWEDGSMSYFYSTEEGYEQTYWNSSGTSKTDTGFYFSYNPKDNLYYFPCCEPVWVSLNMNSGAREGDLVTVKWFQTVPAWDENDNYFNETRLLNAFEWEVQACADDLFILEKLLVPEGYPLGLLELEFYFKDRLIGTTQYSMAQ